MPNDRFYINDELNANTHISLAGEEHHHLCHVMRVKQGEEIELINGKGILAKAKLLEVSKKKGLLQITHSEQSPKSPISHTLAIGLPRFNRMECLVEKTVELGIDKLIFFSADGSEKSELSNNQWERISHLSISALKQCGRLYLPEIELVSSLEAFESVENAFFGDTQASLPCSKVLPQDKNCTFFIGPEKGFSARETSYLKEVIKAQGVCLNLNILRIDTAAIAAAVFLSELKMNKRS